MRRGCSCGDSHSSNVRYVDIKSYGDELKRNKNRIYNAATAAGASYSERALVIAMAMVETYLICLCNTENTALHEYRA